MTAASENPFKNNLPLSSHLSAGDDSHLTRIRFLIIERTRRRRTDLTSPSASADVAQVVVVVIKSFVAVVPLRADLVVLSKRC